MPLERRIAFAVFAVGLLLVLVALAGCGGGSESPDDLAVERCSPQNSTLPVLAIQANEERSVVRVVAPGKACGFAVDSYRKTLYVELRKRSEASTDYAQLECYDLALKQPIGGRFKTTAISPGKRRQADRAHVASLLESGECAAPSQRDPSFILD